MKRLAWLVAVVLTGAQLLTPAAAEDPRHPVAKALDNNTNVWFVSNLQPNNRQLLDILTATRAGRQIMTAYEQDSQQATLAAAPLFRQEIEGFRDDQAVPEDTEAALRDYRGEQAQRRTKMLVAVDTQIRQVRRALAPEQVHMVDWTRPAEATALADNQSVLEEMRQLNADLGEATRMLERIRYLIASDYITSRIGRIDDYLRGYIRPNTQEFADARDWMLALMDEVRQVPENQWPQQSSLYAGRILQYLGVLEPAQGQQTRARYNWWDVYYLLTDPQSPGMLQQMLAARGNPAG